MLIVAYSGWRSCKKEESGVFKPVAIFHRVVIVGADCPRSICPNIGLLTPVSLDASSKLIFILARISRSLSPIVDAGSVISFTPSSSIAYTASLCYTFMRHFVIIYSFKSRHFVITYEKSLLLMRRQSTLWKSREKYMMNS